MVKLSILIAAGNESLLDSTLVSVLQSRPAGCEIVVVCDEGYGDPYGLAGEVRFLLVPPECDEIARLNRGLPECRAPIVHILRCGAEVREGWTDTVALHFDDPQVAAVAPLVLARDSTTHVEAAGVEYRSGGARVVRLHRTPAAAVDGAPSPVLGPSLTAAFYRRSCLIAAGEVFCSAIGGEFADVDLALRLSHRGFRAVLEPRSRVIAAPATAPRSPRANARFAERLFWRHAASRGWFGSLVRHAGVVAAESAANLLNPLQAGRFLGRAAGILDQLSGRSRFAATDNAVPPPDEVDGVARRVDPPAPSGGRKHRPRHGAPRAA